MGGRHVPDVQQQILAELRRANEQLAQIAKLVKDLPIPPDVSDIVEAEFLLQRIVENTGGSGRPKKILGRRRRE